MNKTVIVSIIAMLATLPSFSSGIPSNTNSATCNNATLEKYSGTSNLQANWQANTINITWYNGDSQVASNSCTYGGALTIPSAPSKTGYTFKGWRVRQATGGVCGLTKNTLRTLGNIGTATGYVNSHNESGAVSCGSLYNYNCIYSGDEYQGERWDDTDSCQYQANEISCSNSNVSDLNTEEWKVNLSYGTFKGVASCSTTEPVIANEEGLEEQYAPLIENGSMTYEDFFAIIMSSTANSNIVAGDTSGHWCWCKVVSYVSNGGAQCNLSSLPWFGTLDSYHGCSDNGVGCANLCVMTFLGSSGVRRALLGISQ